MSITYETRQMSFTDIKTKRKPRQDEILSILGNREMTAKEIAVELLGSPFAERNYAAPRLNELEKQGRVAVIGKRKCQYTNKMVAVYKAIDWSQIGVEQGHVTEYE